MDETGKAAKCDGCIARRKAGREPACLAVCCLDAIDRMLATELANREASKRARLMRQARFPVPKSLDGYDFANVRLPDGYTKEQLTGLDFAAKAQDLVFYGKIGRASCRKECRIGCRSRWSPYH